MSRKTFLSIAIVGLTLAGHSAARAGNNPFYPPHGALSRYQGYWLQPGERIGIGAQLGLTPREHGLEFVRVDANVGTQSLGGRLSLVVNSQVEDWRDLPWGGLQYHAFNIRTPYNEVGRTLQNIQLHNMGWAPVYVQDFVVHYRNPQWGPPPPPPVRRVVRRIYCASHDHRLQRCFVGHRLIDARIVRQHSDSPCIPGRSFGAHFAAGEVWTTNGCRADFDVTLEQ